MTIIPLSSIRLKVNFTEFRLNQKRNNMFIRIIAAIGSWFCFQMWFCHVLLKWYCNSLLLLSRLARVTKKTAKNVALNLKMNQPLSWQWLVTRVAWAVSGPLNSGKQFMSWLKAQWKTESDYVYCPIVWKLLHHAFHDCLPQNFDWFVHSIKVLY